MRKDAASFSEATAVGRSKGEPVIIGAVIAVTLLKRFAGHRGPVLGMHDFHEHDAPQDSSTV